MATKNEERRYVVRTGAKHGQQWYLNAANVHCCETTELSERLVPKGAK